MPIVPVTPPHLGGSYYDQVDVYTFMPDIWKRLIEDYGVKSVLDVGCGCGWSTAWFAERGLKALGIEGDPRAIAARRCDLILPHDFTLGPASVRDIFDLGWAAEFVEHVEERFMGNWMAALQRCKFVCITHALPDQGGHHHVNEQTTEYWVEQFARYGFDHDEAETTEMRATSKGETWGRKTLTFFRNTREPVSMVPSSAPDAGQHNPLMSLL